MCCRMVFSNVVFFLRNCFSSKQLQKEEKKGHKQFKRRRPASEKDGSTKSTRRSAKSRKSVKDEDDATQNEDSHSQSRTVRKKALAKRQEKRRQQPDNPIALAQLRKFCEATVETGVGALVQQFQYIKNTTSVCRHKSAFEANPSKNRYKDVPCADKTRVILNWPDGGDDYIHANWVDFMGERKFICTQGPIKTTIDDFWRLIWQEKVRAIVMLCEIMEQGKKKCEAYWPSESGKAMKVPSGLLIKNLNVTQVENTMTVTILEVSFGEEKLLVKHIKWNNWPDRGVPKHKMAPFRLLGRINNVEPVVIHCSAGIGRTGTIVGLHMALKVLSAGEELVLANVVKELRMNRHGSVQTEVQFIYMHRTLLSLAENKGVVKSSEVERFAHEYEFFINGRSF